MIVNGMKKCLMCGKQKPISEFSKNKKLKDGLCNQCKKCNAEKKKLQQKENPLKFRLRGIKGGAKTRNLKWAIPDEYVYKLMQSPCIYCGSIDKNYNGLDRVNSSKGYTVDNVVSCCGYCNLMKNDKSVRIFLKQVGKIYKYNKGKIKL